MRRGFAGKLLPGFFRRGVVADDDLDIFVRLPDNGIQGLAEILGIVVRRDTDACKHFR